MMMMSRFVQSVINSPQTRYRSAEQVGRANFEGERVAVRKLFQMTGPAIAKLLIHCMVLVLGTDSKPVPADRRCRLPTIAEIARQSSAKYTSVPIRVDMAPVGQSWTQQTARFMEFYKQRSLS